MTDYTLEQMVEISEEIERNAALNLGKMLFAFSRLDLSINLFLVWSDEGKQLEKLTNKVAGYSFHKKLNFLEQLIDNKYEKNSKAHSDYANWLEEAHTIRITRNDLVHGRWGVEPKKRKVANVVGLPTSPKQRSILYSINELEQILKGINRLRESMEDLRKRWPV